MPVRHRNRSVTTRNAASTAASRMREADQPARDIGPCAGAALAGQGCADHPTAVGQQALDEARVLRRRVEPDDPDRDPELAVGERDARQALEVAGVVVEIADEDHERPRDVAPPDDVERK